MADSSDPAAPLPAHVVVLAAGRGSRLGDLGDETPKWLLSVAGRTLADRQLEGLRRAGDAVGSITVVAGHAAAAIEARVARLDADVAVLTNAQYVTRNNWWSVLCALRALPEDGAPVVVVNADLLVDPEHLARFVGDAVAGTDDALIAVDLARPLNDESMKVARRPDGALGAIGKVGVERPVGEYIGMVMARGTSLWRFRVALESYVDIAEHTDNWYEAAVGATAADGVAWAIWPVPDGTWVEIDDAHDLAAAEALARAATYRAEERHVGERRKQQAG